MVIVICSRQGVVECGLARAFRELAPKRRSTRGEETSTRRGLKRPKTRPASPPSCSLDRTVSACADATGSARDHARFELSEQSRDLTTDFEQARAQRNALLLLLSRRGLGAAFAELLAGARDREAVAVKQVFDRDQLFDVATRIDALPLARLL